MLEEYVQQSREEIRQMFGDVGLKEDCANYVPCKGCRTCKQYDTGRHTYEQCEMDVCYFYKPQMPRKKENHNA